MFPLAMSDAAIIGICTAIVSLVTAIITAVLSYKMAQLKEGQKSFDGKIDHVTALVNSSDSKREEEKKELKKEVVDLKIVLQEKKDLINENLIVETIREALKNPITPVAAPAVEALQLASKIESLSAAHRETSIPVTISNPKTNPVNVAETQK